MDKLEILINGQSIDLGNQDKLNIANTYAIADINDIDARKNSTTKEIKVPATQKNKIIFGFPEDLSSVQNLNQKTQIEGVQIYGGVEIMRGLVKMIKPITKDSTDYVFTIIGESGDWRNRMDKKRLFDIDLTDQEHAYTKDNINISETVGGGRIYSYPLIDNGRLGVFKALAVWNLSAITAIVFEQEFGTYANPAYPLQNMVGLEIVLVGFGLSENLVTTVIQQYDSASANGIIIGISPTIDLSSPDGVFYLKNGSNHVKVTDRIPAIQIQGLVFRMFKDLGYKIKSNWLSNTGSKLFMLKQISNNSQFNDEFYEQFNFKARLVSNQTILHTDTPDFDFNISDLGIGFVNTKLFKIKFNQTEFDNSQLFDINEGFFSPRVAGQYKFNLKLKITSTPIGRFRVSFLKIDANAYVNSNGVNIGVNLLSPFYELQNTSEPAYDHDFELSSGYYNINPGDKVYAVIKNVSGMSNDFIIKAEGSEFTNEMYEKRFTYNSIVNLQRFLPDIGQLDLLKALKHLFNLYFITDVGKKIVYFEPRDTFYTNDVLDWTDKLDLSKEIENYEIGEDMQKRMLFAYNKDVEDVVIEENEKVTGYRLASKEVSIDNIFVDDELTENANEIFCPTKMQILQQAPAVNFLSTEVPTMKNGEEKIIFDTRLLFYEGTPSALAPGESWKFENDVKTNVPKFYSVDKNNYNYNSLFFDSFSKSVGLFDKHYAGMWDEINNSKIFTAYLNLKPTDIQGFVTVENDKKDYRAKVNLRYGKELHQLRINKIYDYDPIGGKSTKVDFVKITNAAKLPIYPIASFVLINISATYANGTPNNQATICLTVQNLGSEMGDVSVIISMPGVAEDYPFTFTVWPNTTQTNCAFINFPNTTPTGVINGTVKGTVNGEFDLFINGCDTPANVVFDNLVSTPDLTQLVEGGNVNFAFNIENLGCKKAKGSETITLRHVITDAVLKSVLIEDITVMGLDDTTVNAYFRNLPVGYQAPDYLVRLKGEGLFAYDGFISVPPSNVAAPPHINSLVPVDDSINVSPNSTFSMTFNENVTAGTGVLKIINSQTGALHQQLAAASMFYSGPTVYQNFNPPLLENTNYHILVDSGFVKNVANVGFEGISNPTMWNFKAGAFLSIQVPNSNRINGWTMKTGAIGGAFSVVRGAATSDTFSGSTNPPLFLTLEQTANPKWILRRGHAFFKTDNVLPPGATLIQAFLRVTRTLSSNPDDAQIVVKSNTNVLNNSAYSNFVNTQIFEIPAEIGGTVDYEINTSFINLSGWSNFTVLNKRDFTNNVSGVVQNESYFFAGNIHLILKYSI